MRLRAIVVTGAALAVSLAAALSANALLQGQAAMPRVEQAAPRAPTGTIVVAGTPLRFGGQLERAQLKTIDWPADRLPEGAFKTVEQVFAAEKNRFVLSAIEPNEPILEGKITGPGQRPTLAAMLSQGLRAITVRVNDVNGVGGFVLPGEKVDVLVTGEHEQTHFADIMAQNVRVLAVDQIADDRTTDPVVAKAVTLAVDAEQAQRIALGAAIGHISLALRESGENIYDPTARITLADLGRGQTPAPAQATPGAPAATVGIRRGMEREEYAVTRSSPVLAAR